MAKGGNRTVTGGFGGFPPEELEMLRGRANGEKMVENWEGSFHLRQGFGGQVAASLRMTDSTNCRIASNSRVAALPNPGASRRRIPFRAAHHRGGAGRPGAH